MRVLFTCVAADGHFFPLVPLARAFRDRGDDVAFASAPSFAGRIESAGLTALPAGLDQAELEARYAPDRARLQTMPIPERRPFAFERRFAHIDSPARLDELLAHAGAWKPDVIVHDAAELAGPVVAALFGLPSVHHSFGRIIPRTAIDRAARSATAMWERVGLEPEPLAGMFRGTYVDIAPPSLSAEQPPRGTAVIPLRPVERTIHQATAERPLVYVTLGTIVSGVAIFRVLLAALATIDADVLVTTGAQNDPAELEPFPSNATVVRYIPQAEILPRASVVVTHGGSGSVLGALAHGLPMLVVPQQADQFDNAAAATAAGAARALIPDELTESAVRDAAQALLDDHSYRAAARVIAAEIAAMPGAAQVAEQIEEQCLSTT